MQRIERYGVIALVFLLVTILAVAVWGQRKNQSLLSFLKRDSSNDVAKLELPLVPDRAPGGTEIPLSDPTHTLIPAAPLPQGAPPIDATNPLAPIDGPGDSAVAFDHGTPANPGNVPPGFVDEGTNAVGGLTTPKTTIVTPPASGARTYKVKAGDTLGGIAQRELGSTKRWKEIEALNGVSAERLAVGTLLKLPSGTSSAAPQTLVKADNATNDAAPRKANAVVGDRYNVRPGDSLSKIASAQLGDANRYGEILLLNPGVDPRKLSVGQTLRMPAGARTPAVESSKPKSRPAPDKSELARVDGPKKAKVQ